MVDRVVMEQRGGSGGLVGGGCGGGGEKVGERKRSSLGFIDCC